MLVISSWTLWVLFRLWHAMNLCLFGHSVICIGLSLAMSSVLGALVLACSRLLHVVSRLFGLLMPVTAS